MLLSNDQKHARLSVNSVFTNDPVHAVSRMSDLG